MLKLNNEIYYCFHIRANRAQYKYEKIKEEWYNHTYDYFFITSEAEFNKLTTLSNDLVKIRFYGNYNNITSLLKNDELPKRLENIIVSHKGLEEYEQLMILKYNNKIRFSINAPRYRFPGTDLKEAYFEVNESDFNKLINF